MNFEKQIFMKKNYFLLPEMISSAGVCTYQLTAQKSSAAFLKDGMQMHLR
jgi:hypothetical protein